MRGTLELLCMWKNLVGGGLGGGARPSFFKIASITGSLCTADLPTCVPLNHGSKKLISGLFQNPLYSAIDFFSSKASKVIHSKGGGWAVSLTE